MMNEISLINQLPLFVHRQSKSSYSLCFPWIFKLFRVICSFVSSTLASKDKSFYSKADTA